MNNSMSNQSTDNVLNLINEQINDNSIEEVTYKVNKKKGIINISGKKNDIVFSATKNLFDNNGIMQITSKFNKDISKNEKVKYIKDLSKKGLRQQEIANMLGISQAYVSNVLHW